MIIIIIIIIDNNETTTIHINGKGMLGVALDHVQLSNVGTIYLPSLPAIILSLPGICNLNCEHDSQGTQPRLKMRKCCFRPEVQKLSAKISS